MKEQYKEAENGNTQVIQIPKNSTRVNVLELLDVMHLLMAIAAHYFGKLGIIQQM